MKAASYNQMGKSSWNLILLRASLLDAKAGFLDPPPLLEARTHFGSIKNHCQEWEEPSCSIERRQLRKTLPNDWRSRKGMFQGGAKCGKDLVKGRQL